MAGCKYCLETLSERNGLIDKLRKNIVRGKAPAGGFKFEVKVNGVIYGPPDVVSFSHEDALQNLLTSSFLSTQGTEEKKKAKAECAKYALRSLGQP